MHVGRFDAAPVLSMFAFKLVAFHKPPPRKRLTTRTPVRFFFAAVFYCTASAAERLQNAVHLFEEEQRDDDHDWNMTMIDKNASRTSSRAGR